MPRVKLTIYTSLKPGDWVKLKSNGKKMQVKAVGMMTVTLIRPADTINWGSGTWMRTEGEHYDMLNNVELVNADEQPQQTH